MKIINKTAWDTSALRAIASRVARECVELSPTQRKTLTITFKVGHHGGGASGRCFVNMLYTVRVFLPSPNRMIYKKMAADGQSVLLRDVRSVAMVIAHEIMHGLGFVHTDLAMKGDWYNNHQSDRYAWADDITIGLAPAAIKPPKQTSDNKLAKAEAMVKKWQTKIKRDTTYLKKWQRKVKYYQKQTIHSAA